MQVAQVIGHALRPWSHVVHGKIAEQEVALAAAAPALFLADQLVLAVDDVCHATPKSISRVLKHRALSPLAHNQTVTSCPGCRYFR